MPSPLRNETKRENVFSGREILGTLPRCIAGRPESCPASLTKGGGPSDDVTTAPRRNPWARFFRVPALAGDIDHRLKKNLVSGQRAAESFSSES